MQKFSYKTEHINILFDDDINIKSINEIANYLEYVFTCNNLPLQQKYVIEGNMGDYIIWDNYKIDLIGECS